MGTFCLIIPPGNYLLSLLQKNTQFHFMSFLTIEASTQ